MYENAEQCNKINCKKLAIIEKTYIWYTPNNEESNYKKHDDFEKNNCEHVKNKYFQGPTKPDNSVMTVSCSERKLEWVVWLVSL